MISIIIRTRNEGKALEVTLDKLSKQNTDFDLEIIIVDSDSTDDTIKIANNFGCKIVNITRSNFSWGKGLNSGIEASTGDFCVFLSAHCYPVNYNLIQNLISPMIKNKMVAATYGRQIPISRLDPFEEVELDLWFPRSKSEKFAISNSNACVRKEVWDKIKFDETLSSCEDEDWATRVRDSGFLIRYVPKAPVFHSHPININTTYVRWYYRGLSEAYMLRKTRKFKIASKFGATIPALFQSVHNYIFWFILTTKYFLKQNYFMDLWKIPCYEFLRTYGLYNGIKDCITDLRNDTVPTNRSYFKPKIPIFLKNLKFLTK